MLLNIEKSVEQGCVREQKIKVAAAVLVLHLTVRLALPVLLCHMHQVKSVKLPKRKVSENKTVTDKVSGKADNVKVWRIHEYAIFPKSDSYIGTCSAGKNSKNTWIYK